MTKSEFKTLRERFADHIPDGPQVHPDTLVFRRTKEHEIFPCGVQVGNDMQSGPYYCSGLAEYICTPTEGMRACLCERHKPKNVQE